jgi:hypothetical protein
MKIQVNPVLMNNLLKKVEHHDVNSAKGIEQGETG